jgi:CheY-like chemotaxis protein
VLLVEDDDSLLDLLRRTLERGGFDVVTAVHGQDALTRFEEQTVDLVVTDILMPRMDGFELMRRLKSKSPHLPIVAMSGITDLPAYRKLALDSGANTALTKPIGRAQLVELLRRIATAIERGDS